MDVPSRANATQARFEFSPHTMLAVLHTCPLFNSSAEKAFRLPQSSDDGIMTPRADATDPFEIVKCGGGGHGVVVT